MGLWSHLQIFLTLVRIKAFMFVVTAFALWSFAIDHREKSMAPSNLRIDLLPIVRVKVINPHE